LGLKGSILFLEIVYFLFLGSSEAAMGGGRAAPVWRVYEPKKMGARSPRARTRGQNPLVYLYANSTTQGSPKEIMKTFLIEDFTMSCEYLLKFLNKFETALMV
jgi:hypothetical protein